MIWSLIVGSLIGMMAGAITNRGESMGCIYNIFAGLVGSFVGQVYLAFGTIVSWYGNFTIDFRSYHCYCSR